MGLVLVCVSFRVFHLVPPFLIHAESSPFLSFHLPSRHDTLLNFEIQRQALMSNWSYNIANKTITYTTTQATL